MRIAHHIVLALASGCLPSLGVCNESAALLQSPALALANEYEPGAIDLAAYWVSEKYDGVRAYWDGARLLTRGGHVIPAPAWFTAEWPSEPLDGELWIGRGEFQALMATVRDVHPDPVAWRRVRYMVFDAPSERGEFEQRQAALQKSIARARVTWLQLAPQWKVADEAELHRQLQHLTDLGAEGLMLRRTDAPYRAQRSDDLLKVKLFDDAEAEVLAHLPGKGKYEGMLGALEVRSAAGVVFRVGTGFSDDQRRNPPAVGALITYRYRGMTESGIPRFASFVRVRERE